MITDLGKIKQSIGREDRVTEVGAAIFNKIMKASFEQTLEMNVSQSFREECSRQRDQ